jgi:tRNA A37 threonylcarbamoyladenosine dehydratase
MFNAEFEHKLLERLDNIVSALDDLTAAVTNLQTAATAAVAAITSGSDSSAIEAAVIQINDVTTSLNNAVSPPATAGTSTSTDTPINS